MESEHTRRKTLRKRNSIATSNACHGRFSTATGQAYGYAIQIQREGPPACPWASLACFVEASACARVSLSIHLFFQKEEKDAHVLSCPLLGRRGSFRKGTKKSTKRRGCRAWVWCGVWCGGVVDAEAGGGEPTSRYVKACARRPRASRSLQVTVI
jgi:hypothetical protein